MGPEAMFCAKPAVMIRHNITVNIRILFMEMRSADRYKVNHLAVPKRTLIITNYLPTGRQANYELRINF
jgi:hypothetical protein